MRHVSEWGADGEGEALFDTTLGYIDYEAETVEEIDSYLADHGFPPLSEWVYYDGRAGDDTPRYETDLVEDQHGIPRSDGKYIARYAITVEKLTIEPYIIE
jgi:hypothetical protein